MQTESLNGHITEYRRQLAKSQIQKAYLGIMKFMSGLKSHLENKHPEYVTSALYFGYMDMTYFAFTPAVLREQKLKIAIVYLHEPGRFEAWLGGNNRTIQAAYIKRLSHIDLGRHQLSRVAPGVDAIIESVLIAQPDFDQAEALMHQIESTTLVFINEIISLITEIALEEA